MKTYIKKAITRIDGMQKLKLMDDVVVEYPLKIELNGHPLITTICTPKSIKQLVVGFLYSEGFIDGYSDIMHFNYTDDIASVSVKKYVNLKEKYQKSMVMSTGGEKDMDLLYKNAYIKHKQTNSLTYRANDIFRIMNEFTNKSQLFLKTGGVHSVMIKGEDFVYFDDDIGRHNAIDKVVGHALINNVKLNNAVLFTSGRVSSEILLKANNANVSVIVSKSAPTHLAIELAERLSMTLIGFLRGKRMNIYANDTRIIR